jgi:ADP-heptose:LPS heptosyltransferase
MVRTEMPRPCLVHLASGVGNVVLATPLLVALDRGGYIVDICLDADYAQTADLLRPWGVVRAVHTDGIVAAVRRERGRLIVPAVPPFYWNRFAPSYRTLAGCTVVPRPPDPVFLADEQAYYLAFAEALGCTVRPRPMACLPIAPLENEGRVGLGTVVIAPGCKTGTMAAKRWPYFASLADRFDDVAVVGTSDDLRQYDGTPMRFPAHSRSFIDVLTLRETAELMAASGVVVANDSGLAHVAAASGVQTVMLFGPTDHACLGPLPPNATVVRAGLACEPCWRSAPMSVCRSRMDCLRTIDVDRVERTVRSLLGADGAGEGDDGRSAVCAG